MIQPCICNYSVLELQVTVMQVILSRSELSAGFTPKHPDFDPLGVVDLESTRQQSLVGMYVAFRI
jgi:hypothetical protein